MATRLNSNAFERLARATAAVMNPEVERWKDGGGRVIGYFSEALPEEIITAAGMLPVRLRAPGSQGTELADSFFGPLNCTFPRHAFNTALEGGYDFIDGLVMFNSCDHVRRMYDHWVRQMKTPFAEILSLPRKAGRAQVEWFRGELAELRRKIESHYGVEIGDQALRDAIVLQNETRRLLRELYELRKADAPPITGAEALAVTVASTTMPQAIYNECLRELLADLAGAPGITNFRARLMILGSELDDPEYIEIIEEQGGLVVTDSLCFGSKILWKEVDEDAVDPLMALSQYYVEDRPAHARMFTEYDRRAAYVHELIDEFRVDGVIFQRLTFCELWGYEQFTMQSDFKEWDVPCLSMDREYKLNATGQLRTRVQAFLETVEGR
jgi:benzoyl-CoA reductase/2-hydroxyglutaryl-CoA dehydratase subunit BcrC/BadD/HgdB